jgi:hypothetical protein
MRKLVLMTALLLASVSAHAGENRGLDLAANDASSTPGIAAPLPPIKKSQESKQEAKQGAKPEPKQEPKQHAAGPARPLPPTSARHVQAGRYAAQEAKARRIAARYGIHW